MTDQPIVLLHPAPRSGWQLHRRVEFPLGLLHTATPVDRLGYKVRIIDQYADPAWKSELEDALSKKPLCFGVSTMTGPQIHYGLEACAEVRRRYPDVPLVWGGIHPSLLPGQTLAHPLVDIVVEGEGEETFAALVQALEAGTPLKDVAGIWFKEGSTQVRTARRDFTDLDRLPPLSYHLLKVGLYSRKLFGSEYFSFNSSRGCAYRCKFCWDPVMHQRRFRAMRPATVIAHLERLVRDYGLRKFLFTDDNFFVDMNRARGILEEVANSRHGIALGKLQVRADAVCRMDREFLYLLIRAGVRRLTIGVESGSPRILKMVSKDETVDSMLEANGKLKDIPIVPLYFFMMGFPTETREELGQSVALALRLLRENPNADASFNIYTPYPGTPLFRESVEHGLPEPQSLEQWALTSFRKVPPKGAHVPDETVAMIDGLDLPMMFLGTRFSPRAYRTISPMAKMLGKLYYPFAMYRLKHLEPRFPIETKIARALGIFAKDA
jgi:radical SAM superfamily enzyme YgiQ (UPF0313 family)